LCADAAPAATARNGTGRLNDFDRFCPITMKETGVPARLYICVATFVLTTLTMTACGGSDSTPQPPMSPTPPPPQGGLANLYILPGATTLGTNAFGDHPLVIYTGETMRWRNIDDTTHALVADSAGVPEFRETDNLAPGAEQSFNMTKTGTTTFHCKIHPSMVGTLIVQQR
jgi:hypothetical protein